MVDDKFLRYSKTLHVAYVYEQDAQELVFYEKLFKTVTPYRYSEFLQNSNAINVDIIFINFTTNDMKSLFIALSNLSAKKVIFTPHENNPSFLKNALKFKVDIVTKYTDDEKKLYQLFQNLLKNISKEYKQKVQTKRYETMIDVQLHGFIYLYDEKIVYMSTKLQELFEVKESRQFYELYIKSGIQTQLIDLFLTPQNNTFIDIETKSGQKVSVLAVSKKVEGAMVVSFTPLEALPQNQTKTDKFLNRLSFIEEIKNHIVHKDKDQSCAVNLVTVKINNMDTIAAEFGNYKAYAFCDEFMNHLKKSLDKDGFVSLWGGSGFVLLSENQCYDSLKEALQEFTKQINYKVFENNVIPFIKASLVKVKGSDINEIITLTDDFFKAKVPLELAQKYEYHEVCQIKESMEDMETLFYYFSNIMYSQTPLKLLNIYKGVHISTTGFIQKIEGEKMMIKAKNIQLYTMQLEKKTVLQCSSLPKDIEVDVEVVDLKKNLAVFTNPKLLEFSANNRETTRVQSDFRFPVKMKQERVMHSGEILDLSMRSVAIKFPLSVQKQFSQGRVEVSFRVPVETHDDGFFQTQIEGKLIRFNDIDHRYTKAIVLLEMEEPDEGYVLEYIYSRQKEIIFEIKKLALKGLSKGL